MKKVFEWGKEGDDIKLMALKNPSDKFFQKFFVATTRGMYYYNRDTKKMEEVVAIVRNDILGSLENYKNTKDTCDVKDICFAGEDIKKKLGYYTRCVRQFEEEEELSIATSDQTFTINTKEMRFFAESYNREILSKVIVSTKDDVLRVDKVYFQFSFFKMSMQCKTMTTSVMFNLKSGLTYFSDQNMSSLRNCTTSDCQNFLEDINDDIYNCIIDEMATYYKSNYGIEINKTYKSDPKDTFKTLRSLNFNPANPELIAWKSFFGPRYRKYFERTKKYDVFKELAKILEFKDLEDSEEMISYYNNYPQNVLLYKYFEQMGLSKETRFKMLDVFIKYKLNTMPLFDFNSIVFNDIKMDYIHAYSKQNDLAIAEFALFVECLLDVLPENELAEFIDKLLSAINDDIYYVLNRFLSQWFKLACASGDIEAAIDGVFDIGLQESISKVLTPELTKALAKDIEIFHSERDEKLEDSDDEYKYVLAHNTSSLKPFVSLSRSSTKTEIITNKLTPVLIIDDFKNLCGVLVVEGKSLYAACSESDKPVRYENVKLNNACIEFCKRKKIEYKYCSDVKENLTEEDISSALTFPFW